MCGVFTVSLSHLQNYPAFEVCNGEDLQIRFRSRRISRSVLVSSKSIRKLRLKLRENTSDLLFGGVQKKPRLACEAKGKQLAADFNGSCVDKPDNNEDDLAERRLFREQSYQEGDVLNYSEASTSNEDSLLAKENSISHFGRKRFKNRFLLLAKLGTTIRKKLESFFKSEIRQRALVTVLMLIAVRAGHFIPLPGYDRRFMPGDYLSYPSGAGEGVADLGSEMRLSLFQLGIGPYMGASIIMQVLCYIVPQLIRLRKEGSEGIKRIKQYTERLAFAIAVVQAFIISMQSMPYSVYTAESRLKYLVTSVSLMSLGAVVINWICNQITESGFGQGPSLFICVNILTGYADSLYKVISGLIYGGGNWGPNVFALFGFSLCFTVCAVLTSAGQRRVKLQYYHFGLAPTAGAGRLTTEVEPYIPFIINPTGMQPLLATTILMSLPGFFARIYNNKFWISLKDAVTPGSSNPLSYYLITVSFIFLFNILDLGNIPVEVNQYLMKIGARIPGVKPGQQTIEYLTKVQASTRFWGGFWLSLLVIASTLVDNQFRHLHHGDSIGFTSMLIIVSA
ncbi:hypothetical protein GOP47_0023520 [Adiantum capillus-veneris]|uniref:Uncharacterized protein n=1 Tax=Adiantum capillus-veneris TaxID=13818 RepID=A0A9D4Z4L6_ADICA|nr:hypothetical protein GOP47_0023520 [Adiantum capillus-veneris]